MKKKLLFICSGGLDRSLTAESLFKNHSKFKSKSCGLYPLIADNNLTKQVLQWADSF